MTVMGVILYHTTPPENVPGILKDGLLRCHGVHESAFICLSRRPDSWMKPGLALLEVDIEGIDGRLVRQWSEEETDEINVWDDISPERIRPAEKCIMYETYESDNERTDDDN